ncbi:hypothetical protein PsYK624_166520 [Phanerochaete sordida]|uniref:Uncharacterized protein n=1 Tax=Phanerochaete sordida TaxID=48140 RepID=A0A9P3GWZ2_9APHY|nr:hypothetical protein PsYK624_166520 [Phanerochaete sordida]
MSTPLHTLAKVPRGGSLEDALADALSGKPFNVQRRGVLRLCARRMQRRAARRPREQPHSRLGFEVLPQAPLWGRDGEPFADTLPKASAMTADGTRDEDDSILEDEDDRDALESLLATPSEVSFGDNEEIELSQ